MEPFKGRIDSDGYRRWYEDNYPYERHGIEFTNEIVDVEDSYDKGFYRVTRDDLCVFIVPEQFVTRLQT